MMPSATFKGPGLIKGEYTPPGDKSISHRAVMLGALASGTSRFTRFLNAEDCCRTLNVFREMGVEAQVQDTDLSLTVKGVGLKGLKAPGGDLFLGNSGTTMRLLLGILAGQNFQTILTGDESLSSRPMKRVVQPLKQMGAQIKGREDGNFAPLRIRGGKLKGIDFFNRLSSAQVKSALLFAGLYAEGKTRVQEIVGSRDHTERMLLAAGAPLHREGNWIEIVEADVLKPLEMAIPGDISSAAFFIIAAAMLPGSELMVKNVCLNPTRTGILKVLTRMGAKVEVEQAQHVPEQIGSIRIVGSRLSGTRVSKDEIPSLIDELPMLMIAMALAEGESMISGAEELRVKETDRIHSMVQNLSAIGGDLEELPDGCLIRGVEAFKGGKTLSFGDHRTVMSIAMASLASRGDIDMDDIESVRTSYPAFFEDLKKLLET